MLADPLVHEGGSWSSVVHGLASGLAVAAVLALVAAIYNYSRNKRLERRLRSAIAPRGIWDSIYGVGITVDNATNVPVVVRSARLLRESGGSVVLNYFGPADGSCSSPSPRFPEQGRGGSLAHDAAMERGWVELPPFGDGRWGLSMEALKAPMCRDLDPIDVEVVIEYRTLLASRRLITLNSPPWMRGDGLEKLFKVAREEPPAHVRQRGEHGA